jgi:surface protein
LNGWNVSNVTNMAGMFTGCVRFNQPLDHWDISNVTNMRYMFSNCRNFNQPLNRWNVLNVANMDNMFIYSGIAEQNKASVENYNKYLHTQARETGVVFAKSLTDNEQSGMKFMPPEMIEKMLEYHDMGSKENARLATQYGTELAYEKIASRQEAVPAPLPPQSVPYPPDPEGNPDRQGLKRTASEAGLDDASGGRTRRRRKRHGKRKSRKGNNSRKKILTKRY